MGEVITIMSFTLRGGNIRILTMAKRTLNAVLILAPLILFLSVCSTYMMVHFYSENDKLRDKLHALKKRSSMLEMKLLAMRADASTKTADEPEVQVEIVEKEATAQEAPGGMEAATQATVTLEGLRVMEIAGSDGLTINFTVVKKETGGNKLSGMVVLVGKIENEYFAMPQGVGVREGVPANYAKGERFVIRYRRPFERTIPYAADSLDELSIFVYDEHGAMLLHQSVALP